MKTDMNLAENEKGSKLRTTIWRAYSSYTMSLKNYFDKLNKDKITRREREQKEKITTFD